ncbi:MAG: bifunctional folylpolyglutamate synthase/dihydrofolate synthase [Ruminococcaceae bacterium]|nr:bifunctional folylpolyglutamate synthase/dihydrofolate synthase [Oscillospiraceae bacterium]
MNYNEALSYVHSLLVFGSKPGLKRMSRVMEKLGNPQNNLKFIHIAGTNGKGSTATMLSNVYIKAGLRVGLYISPFVIDFRERIQLNGKMIDKTDFARSAQRVKDTGVTLTEFEFITAVAFCYFAEKQCDIVILETGLGGRLDATNIIENPLCSVITHISLDHTGVLGDTIEQIATEKCGIIKNRGLTVSDMNQEPEVVKVIKAHSDSLVVPSKEDLRILSVDIFGNTFIYKGEKYETTLAGLHQVSNAVSVIETVKNTLPVKEETLKAAIKETVFPARCEIISKNPLVVLDGAHNPDGAVALKRVMENYSGEITAIVGMMADKDCGEVLKTLLPHCENVITVTVRENPRSISAEALMSHAKPHCKNCFTAKDYDEAIKKAVALSGGKPVFVFGSLYLASAIRNKLFNI